MTDPIRPSWAPPPPPPPPPPPQHLQQGGYGVAYGAQGYGAPVARNNGMAIASMVLGIVGILMFWLYAVIPVLAIVLGHVALSQINKRGQENRGMAVAGVVTGYIGAGLFALVLLAAVASST